MQVFTLHIPAYDPRSYNAAFQRVRDRCMHLHVTPPPLSIHQSLGFLSTLERCIRMLPRSVIADCELCYS